MYCVDCIGNLMSRGLIMIPGGGSPLHTLSQVIWLLHPNEGKLQSGFPPQRGWNRVSTIGGWNRVPTIVGCGTVFYHRRMEQCFYKHHRSIEHTPLLYTIVELKRFFSIGGWNTVSSPPSENGTWLYSSSTLEDGTGFPHHIRSLGHSSIEGWKSVSTPPCTDGVGFRSTTVDWKDILGMGLPPVKNGTGFPQ